MAISGFWTRSLRTIAAIGAIAGLSFALSVPTDRPAAAAADPTSQVIDLTNIERAKFGLAPLAHNANLAWSADQYTRVLAETGCWGHDCGPVPGLADRMRLAGYTDWRFVGENLAAGWASPEAAVAAWMESSGHRANILNPEYTEIGVGLAHGGPWRIYWAQEFGARRLVAPAPAVTDWNVEAGSDAAEADWTDEWSGDWTDEWSAEWFWE